MTTSTFDNIHLRAKELRAANGGNHSNSGTISVAILAHGKKATGVLQQSDFVWFRTPSDRKLEAVYKAYSQLELSNISNDIVFTHDGSIVTGNSLIAPLNWRNDNLVVLEALKASEVVSETSSFKIALQEMSNMPTPPLDIVDQKASPASHSKMLDMSQRSQNHPEFQVCADNLLSKPITSAVAQQNGSHSSELESTVRPKLKTQQSDNSHPVPPASIETHMKTEDDQGTSFDFSGLCADATAAQLEVIVKRGVSVLENLKQVLKTQERRSFYHAQWMEAIEKCSQQVVKTKTIIGVVGATGAGKSALINAILDHEQLVPTNCMRACTAVVIEISYNEGGMPYRADIEFISHEDWRKELEILFQELFDSNGQVSRECANLESESGIAYAKIKAVYPKLTKEEMENTTVEELMVHEMSTIQDQDSVAFYQHLQTYVDSASREKRTGGLSNFRNRKTREMEYWPLIRVARLYVKASALKSGSVLVDLPGVHDSNQARSAVAQEYLKQCTSVWVVAPISRAVDDKSAKCLLGDTFKRQLKMDGGYNSVTFICSKTDEISITEATSSLGLEEEMSSLWDKIDAFEKDLEDLKTDCSEIAQAQEALIATIDEADKNLEFWKAKRRNLDEGRNGPASKTKSTKRKRRSKPAKSRKKVRPGIYDSDESQNSLSSDEDHENRPTKEDISAKIHEIKEVKRNAERELTKLDKKSKKVEKQTRAVQKQNGIVKAEVAAKCILERNNYSRCAIRQDFAVGVKELDDELAEEADAAAFNPDEDLRDYDEVEKSLPVYCVSSRGYQKLRGRLTKDSDVSGFRDVAQTEIPQLQGHCKQLTEAGRTDACRNFLNTFGHLLNSLKLWSSRDGLGRKLTDDQLKQEEQFLLERLSDFECALEAQVKIICNQLGRELQDNIFERFEAAAEAASSAANGTCEHWGRKTDRMDPAAGGLHWSRYRAVCRRNGFFRDVDFNEQLTEPLVKQMANGWERTFQRSVPGILAELQAHVGDVIRNLHAEIEARYVHDTLLAVPFQILKHSIPAYAEDFRDAANLARTTITEGQRDINREFTVVVAEHMMDAYQGCDAESGAGTFGRMKDLMARHIDIQRGGMFTDSANTVGKLLQKLIEKTEVLLLEKADEVYTSVKREYMRVLLGLDNTDGEFLLEERQVRRAVAEILEDVEVKFKKLPPTHAAAAKVKAKEEMQDCHLSSVDGNALPEASTSNNKATTADRPEERQPRPPAAVNTCAIKAESPDTKSKEVPKGAASHGIDSDKNLLGDGML